MVYMVFGEMIAIVGMLFGIGLVSSSTAERDKFGDIECARLRVVDADGKVTVIITASDHGGAISIHGNDRLSWASLGIDEHGGVVGVRGKGGKAQASWLSIDENGGRVDLIGKGEGKVAIGINEYGNGVVSTWDKNGYRQ